MAETGLTSIRDAIRWGLLLAAVGVAGFRLPRVYGDFRGWQEVRLSDPSAAELYRLNFEVSVVGIAIILCIGVAAFYLLRRRTREQ